MGIEKTQRIAAGLVVVLLLGLALLGAGCGGSSSSSTSAHRTAATATSPAAKSKFVGHAGVAFGVFHRYVYDALKAGRFGNPALHKGALVKARAATAAAAHEIALAKQAAVDSTALRKLFGPLAALEPTLRVVATSLNHGHVDAAGIKSANGAIAGVEQIGSAAGVKIFERAPAVR